MNIPKKRSITYVDNRLGWIHEEAGRPLTSKNKVKLIET